jgi:hypothetical protein
MAEEPTDKRERYVDYANCCLQLAKVVSDNNSRVLLREMASEWLKLAEQSYDRDQPAIRSIES